MNTTSNPFSLQWAKDRLIESGAESWARPLWVALTGRRPSLTDAELSKVMARVLKPNSICIDVGAHKGLIVDDFIRHAPQGTFHAFEPIPYLARLLRRKYRSNPRVKLYELGLSDSAGPTTFYINKSEMGYSSLAAPDHNTASKDVETCTVEIRRLDDLLPEARPDLIKIDVEGAELGVLRGAKKMLARSRPVVAFEHALGSADRFGTKPEDVFDFLAGSDFQISLMARYLANELPLTRSEFCNEFYRHSNYFFIAYPK
ncbi:MAG: FkbM family methyltransferase [Candidatus Acidiferrum sp.]